MNFQDMKPFWDAGEQAIERYDFYGERQMRLLHRSENVMFLLSDEKEKKPCEVMRVARPGYHRTAELEAEIQWLERLAEEERAESFSDTGNKGGESRFAVRAAHPVRNRSGESITGVLVNGQPYICVVFEYLEGKEPNPRTDPDAADDFYQIGRIAASLHLQTMEWTESRRLCRPHWNYENMLGKKALFGDWRLCRELDPQEYAFLKRTTEVIRQRLERYGRTEQNYGLIHSDLRAANLLKHNGQIQVIDFDDCGFGWHLYDLAASISFIEDDERVEEWVQAWLRGYETLLKLTKTDRAEIPTFIMARRIQLLAWITSHDDSDPVKAYYPGFAGKTVEMARKYFP